MNLKKIASALLLLFVLKTTQCQILPITQGGHNYLVNKGFDSNLDGFIEVDELQSGPTPHFYFDDMYNYYRYNSGGYDPVDIQADLNEMNAYIYPNEAYIFDMSYDEYEEFTIWGRDLGGNPVYMLYDFEIEPGNTEVYFGAGIRELQISSNDINIPLLILPENTQTQIMSSDSIKIGELRISNSGFTSLSGINYCKIDTFTSVNSRDVFPSNATVNIINYLGEPELDYTKLNYYSISFGGSLPDFICVNNDEEWRISGSSDLIVSSNCDLKNPTNQIADVNTKLANALINATPSIDFNGDNIIQGWELVRADSIIIPGEDIDSLDGIHLASNLVYLDVSDNNLDTIKLENFPKLEYLNIAGNDISTIDFGGDLVSDEDTFDEVAPTTTGSALDTLIVDDNNLTSLDVSELNLSYLSAINNPSLDYICVSSDQMDNDTPNWDKDVSTEYSVGCSIISSTNEIHNQQNIIYPNPATDFISFSNSLVSISNIEGKIIFDNKNATTLNITKWAKGIYFAQFDNGESQKLVIK